MNEQEREQFLLYARTLSFARKVEQAQQIIGKWLGKSTRPYVAFSGGKDSAVSLSLVREQAPDTVAVFSDDEWNLPETLEFIECIPNLVQIAARVKHAEWFISWEHGPINLRPGVQWIETEHNDGLQTWARMNRRDGAAIGIRADENTRRVVHIKQFGTCFFAGNNQVWQCYPLAWWTDVDVWAFIVSRGLVYNRAYDVLDGMGVPLRDRRIGPFAVDRVMGRGQLALLKQGWADLFNRFAEKYPEARNFV